MAVKAVNNITVLDDLVLILLIFEAYLRMQSMDLPALITIQRAAIIEKIMKQIRKIRAKNQMIDALNTRNELFVDLIHDPLLNFDILVWRKDNIGQTSKWTGSFKLLSIKNETYKIDLLSSLTEFWSIVIKSYLVDDDNIKTHFSSIINFLPLAQDLLPDNISLPITKTLFMPITRLFQVPRPPMWYQNIADVFTFLQKKDILPL